MRSPKRDSLVAHNEQAIRDKMGRQVPEPKILEGTQREDKGNSAPTSPICRCRVTYLGSAVPHITKDGLQGIQEPLRELYPDRASLTSSNIGIDSWLSVWSNGILIENVDDTGREVKRFFKIEALHYCAAVKYVPQLPHQQLNQVGSLAYLPKFLPLDSPHARSQQTDVNPPIFASILRRTTGVKVLECHAFICKREAAANALVRCCFHAYADTMYAKQIGADVGGVKQDVDSNNNGNQSCHYSAQTLKPSTSSNESKSINVPSIASRRSKSTAALNDTEGAQNGYSKQYDTIYDLNQNEIGHAATLARNRGLNDKYATICDLVDGNSIPIQNLNLNCGDLKQQSNKFSKSMHHLNQIGNPSFPGSLNQAASFLNLSRKIPGNHIPQQPFYNPCAARVPSYPPQHLIDQQQANQSGTMRSIKSAAANSIASTLLRSKKHAKAMSSNHISQDRVTSFHQPNGAANGSFLMPPIFMPNAHARPIIDGSQTMKVPSRVMMPIPGPPINFEAMTPKEMKKLLKKGAKYGIDPSKFGDNGLPLMPIRPMPLHLPPPPPPLYHIPSLPLSKSGTINSQSMYSIHGQPSDMPDAYASMHGLAYGTGIPVPEQFDPQPIKSILVKPNPEFLKSKAGKKWLKQQKEFKKLLPPHLDGLPVVFGPPPIDALEPATVPNIPPPNMMSPPQASVPMMDSSGYYNPHSMYGPSGRASTASTLLRYSPQSHVVMENGYMNGLNGDMNYNREYQCDNSSAIYNTCERQFQQNLDPRLHRHNHMVEQSTISLGDENELDDGEEEDSNSNDHYNRLDTRSIRSRTSNPARSHNKRRDESQDYDQVTPSNDDRSSYSSGIYKRGHMNEKAFSYSIRQEYKSNGGAGSEVDCASGDGNMSDANLTFDPESIYDNSRRRGHISNGQALLYRRG